MARKGSRRSRKRTGIKELLSNNAELIRKGSFLLIVLAVMCGVVLGIRHFFLNSSFFRIEEVLVNSDRGHASEAMAEKVRKTYVGRNIFSVDLGQMTMYVGGEFPEVRKIEVRRNLPDCLEVDMLMRKPVAVIPGGLVVDRDGFVLSSGQGERGLVEIKGLRFFFNAPKPGDRIDNAGLSRALVLLRGLNESLDADSGDVEYVDISDRNNIVLGMNGVEIKMGTDGFSRKISYLKDMLRDPDIDMRDIRYIDLRFEDPVISPR